jgi:hypothetical protein
MKNFIKFNQAPVILRITGSGIPSPYSTLFYPGNSPDNGDPLIIYLFHNSRYILLIIFENIAHPV